MMILLLRRNTETSLDLRLAEGKNYSLQGSMWNGRSMKSVKVSILATLPMYRHLYFTLTLFELWTGWEGIWIWTSLQGTARPPTKNNKTHTSNMEQSIESTYQLIPERSSIMGFCPDLIPAAIWLQVRKTIWSTQWSSPSLNRGLKFPTWNMFPPHLRPQKVQG